MVTDFHGRSAESAALARLLHTHLWDNSQISEQRGVLIMPHGYERLPNPLPDRIRARNDPSALRIRHRPDYLVSTPELEDVYLDYKVSRTPRYSEGQRETDIIPIEAAAWDECMRLSQRGDRVALLVFCPYHPRQLTCEFLGPRIYYRRAQDPRNTQRGSSERFVNVDLSRFRTLSEFLYDELGLPINLTQPLLEEFMKEAINEPLLKILRDPRSRS